LTVVWCGIAACGRSALDEPLAVSGAAGAEPLTGSAGATTGAAGATTGAAGSGDTTGAANATGAAGEAVEPTCTPNDAECVDAMTGHVCLTNGTWGGTFTCPNGCANGVCRECVPGSAMCMSATTISVCLAAGIWGTPTMCSGLCSNGACVDVMNPKTVFVTSKTFAGGELGGLTGADATCALAANGAGLMGTYLAWLSDSLDSPSSRFTRNGGPYRLVGGSVVANDWAGLTSGQLLHAIDVTEIGSPAPTGTSSCAGSTAPVWSDTSPGGTLNVTGDDCGDWRDVTAISGQWGDADDSDGRWTEACGVDGDLLATPTPVCGTPAAIYCVEQ